jgi:hypothetical protein
MVKKDYLEDLLEQYETNNFKISPHDFGTTMKSLLLSSKEEIKYTVSNKILKSYHNKETPIRNNVMYALEKTIPSFKDEQIQLELYQKVLECVLNEKEDWPRVFASWTLNHSAESLNDYSKSLLIKDLDNKLVDFDKEELTSKKDFSASNLDDLYQQKVKAKQKYDQKRSFYRSQFKDELAQLSKDEKECKSNQNQFEFKYCLLNKFQIIVDNAFTYEKIKKDNNDKKLNNNSEDNIIDYNSPDKDVSKEEIKIKELVDKYTITILDHGLDIIDKKKKLIYEKEKIENSIESRFVYVEDGRKIKSDYETLNNYVKKWESLKDNQIFCKGLKSHLIGKKSDNGWYKK